MDYRVYPPHPDLAALVKCYWTLEVPYDPMTTKQRILPDGCIELFFILGDDVKRYTADGFIIQPRAMVLGQITEPFFIEPTGVVHSFAVRFYPYGFANFTTVPLVDLANRETPIAQLLGEGKAGVLTQQITAAADTEERIRIIETFLFQQLAEQETADQIVRSTIDVILQSKGSLPVNEMLKDDPSKRRQLERKFAKQVGISPRQLGKVIRLQAALKMLLHQKEETMAAVAYENNYFDQAHFNKDFKAFTGTSPRAFFGDRTFELSSLIYGNDK